jgi:hypothetical protein
MLFVSIPKMTDLDEHSMRRAYAGDLIDEDEHSDGHVNVNANDSDANNYIDGTIDERDHCDRAAGGSEGCGNSLKDAENNTYYPSGNFG